MKKNIIIFIGVLAFSSVFLNAQTDLEVKSDFEFGLKFNYVASSRIYTLAAENKDAYYIEPETKISKIDYSDLLFDLSAKYLYNDYSLQVNLPIRRQSLSYRVSKENSDTNFAQYDYSLSQIDYIGLSASRQFRVGSSLISPSLGVKIPLKSSSSIYNQKGYDFYYSGGFEALVGASFKKDFRKIKIKSSLFYNYRDLELKDQLLENFSVSYSNVENTALGLYLNMAQSLASYKNSFEFNPKYVSNQEDYIDLGVHFDIDMSDNFSSEFSYSFRVYGKKTYYNSNLGVTIGYRL